MVDDHLSTARVIERMFERLDDLVRAMGEIKAEMARSHATLEEQGDDTRRLISAIEGNGTPGLKQRITTMESYWKVVAWALAPLYAAVIAWVFSNFS